MVHLQDMTSAIQQERLLSGQLQLGFMRRPRRRSCRSTDC